MSTPTSAAAGEALAHLARGGGEVVVATVLGQVAGVAVLEWLHPLQDARPQAWITALVSGAQFRHQGVARALLAESGRRARQAGADRLYFAVASERDEARAFLAVTGFEPVQIVFERKL